MKLSAMRDLNEQDPLPPLGKVRETAPSPKLPPPEFKPLMGNDEVLVGPDGKFETRISGNEAARWSQTSPFSEQDFKPALGFFDNKLMRPGDFFQQAYDEFHKLYEQAFEPGPERYMQVPRDPGKSVTAAGIRALTAEKCAELASRLGSIVGRDYSNVEARILALQEDRGEVMKKELTKFWFPRGPISAKEKRELYGNGTVTGRISSGDSVPASQVPKPADGWIPWEGGECPVERDKQVEVLYRDGHKDPGVYAAQQFRWWHLGTGAMSGLDVVAYRVIGA